MTPAAVRVMWSSKKFQVRPGPIVHRSCSQNSAQTRLQCIAHIGLTAARHCSQQAPAVVARHFVCSKQDPEIANCKSFIFALYPVSAVGPSQIAMWPVSLCMQILWPFQCHAWNDTSPQMPSSTSELGASCTLQFFRNARMLFENVPDRCSCCSSGHSITQSELAHHEIW